MHSAAQLSDNATGAAPPIVRVSGLGKIYASGHVALKHIDLDIRRGEILALLHDHLGRRRALRSRR